MRILSSDIKEIKPKKVKRKCQVLNVAQAKAWRNVVVQDLKTNNKYFFGKVILPPPEINIGDILYIGYEDLPYELPEIKQKIVLLTLDGKQLDWTMV